MRFLSIVPGDGGSRMEAKIDRPPTKYCDEQYYDWQLLWLSVGWLSPWSISCWVEDMVLKYDAKTRTTLNNDGVQTRIPGFGNTSSVEAIGDDSSLGEARFYYKNIADALVDLGYKRGIDLHGAPYDFRKAASKCFFSKKNLVTL